MALLTFKVSRKTVANGILFFFFSISSAAAAAAAVIGIFNANYRCNSNSKYVGKNVLFLYRNG